MLCGSLNGEMIVDENNQSYLFCVHPTQPNIIGGNDD